MNPTGSQKDRALSVSITKAVELGIQAVMLYSDGSTALSSAAYAARANLRSFTLVARDTPDFRLLPLVFYGSTILEYQGDAAEALDWTRTACLALGLYETTTYRLANPWGAEAPKTISYEIVEQLGRVPEWVIVPVGGGGTLCGIWKGFDELRARGEIERCPRLAAVLPAGYSLLEHALLDSMETEDDLRSLAARNGSLQTTVQAKIAMTYPPDGIETIQAIRESRGRFFYATDEQVIQAQRLLGREGIFAEPSSAGTMIAAEQLSGSGLKDSDDIVAVVTGSGFRELDAIANSLVLNKRKIKRDTGIEQIWSWLNEC
jgi:threonine synthase